MKKIYTVATTLVAFCIGILVGVVGSDLKKPSNYPIESPTATIKPYQNEKLTPISVLEDMYKENVPFEEMKVYDETLCLHSSDHSYLLNRPIFYGNNPYLCTKDYCDNGYSIEYLKHIDDTHALIVYKVKIDNNVFYLYMVAKPHSEFSHSNRKNWYTGGEHYYVSSSLKYSDFASIHIGDSIEKVVSIDPAINMDLRWGFFGEKTYRLLGDGILKISFEDDKVSAMEFHSYGDIYSNDGTEVFNILRAEKPIELPRG